MGNLRTICCILMYLYVIIHKCHCASVLCVLHSFIPDSSDIHIEICALFKVQTIFINQMQKVCSIWNHFVLTHGSYFLIVEKWSMMFSFTFFLVMIFSTGLTVTGLTCIVVDLCLFPLLLILTCSCWP